MVLIILMMTAPSAVCGQTPADVPLATGQDTLATAKAATADTLLTAHSGLMASLDSLESPVDTAALTVGPVLTKKDRRQLRKEKVFVPDPQRALWLSFVIPGGGQIYNRKYWKLPIFYGGFLGCIYAFTWNQQMFLDYSQAYLDLIDDNPQTNSYQQMFPLGYDIENNKSRYQTVFKNRKDTYRRWRDLSAFCFIAVYALSIIDAYVDAHLSSFDISPDLSLQWGPTPLEGSGRIGLGATLNF